MKIFSKIPSREILGILKLGYIIAFQDNTEGEKTDYSQKFHPHFFRGR